MERSQPSWARGKIFLFCSPDSAVLAQMKEHFPSLQILVTHSLPLPRDWSPKDSLLLVHKENAPEILADWCQLGGDTKHVLVSELQKEALYSQLNNFWEQLALRILPEELEAAQNNAALALLGGADALAQQVERTRLAFSLALELCQSFSGLREVCRLSLYYPLAQREDFSAIIKSARALWAHQEELEKIRSSHTKEEWSSATKLESLLVLCAVLALEAESESQLRAMLRQKTHSLGFRQRSQLRELVEKHCHLLWRGKHAA